MCDILFHFHLNYNTRFFLKLLLTRKRASVTRRYPVRLTEYSDSRKFLKYQYIRIKEDEMKNFTNSLCLINSFHFELQVSTSGHSDVSRTASDTLAAEFAEYVTVQGSPPVQSPGTRFLKETIIYLQLTKCKKISYFISNLMYC